MASESKEGAKNEVEMAAAAPTAAEKKASEEAAQIISAMDAVVSSAKASGDLTASVDKLLSLEKKARLANDGATTSKVALAILNLCADANDLKALNANILVLSKRRGQIKSVLVDVVQRGMALLEGQLSSLGKDDKIELITTLRTVSEGKIHVEVERARLTKTLAMLKESEGKIAEASEILQEVAVETFGSMERKEKAEFLLEQMRLTLKQRDFVKMGILSGKIAKKQLGEAGFEEIRLRYYTLLIALHQHRHDSLALFRDYEAIAETRGYPEDASKWIPAVQSMVVYLALSLWSNEVSDALQHLKRDKRVADTDSSVSAAAMAPYKALVDALTTDEIIPWPLSNAEHHAVITGHDAFTKATPGPLAAEAGSSASASGMDVDSSSSSSSSSSALHPASSSSSSIVRKEDEARSPWLAILRKRLTQHNVRVVAKWYGRLTVPRMAQLLGLDKDTTEAVVAELAADKALYAKIDRPAGIIVFQRPRPAEEVLSEWGADIRTVLGLLEKTSHLIEKEKLVRGMQVAAAGGR